MSRIKILPEILSNKIAAGEVVERPASVVKELLENAIDAQSGRIRIEIGRGGKSFIRVSDNGLGMSHDDALLSLERYATSKISTDADLYAINTLGFRGEALPSIAAVSRFTLITKTRASVSGTEIYVEGGKIKKVSEAGAPDGTMILVNQLFYNTPARRKFLKTVNTEMAHIAEVVACIAMAKPEIQFELVHNQRVIKNWPRAENPMDRIIDVLGYDLESSLHPIYFNAGGVSVSGYTSDPSVTRSTSQKIYIFVNGRFVRDRGIQYALFEGYRGRIMKGRFPVAVVFLNLPPDQVDVNVHPTKHQVRFTHQKQVYEAVRSAVMDIWKPSVTTQWAPPGTQVHEIHEERPLPFSVPYAPVAKKPAEPGLFQPKPPEPKAPAKPEAEPAQPPSGLRFSDLSVIGQFNNTYIMCESRGILIIIDQHAAHERIVYEHLKSHRQAGSFSSVQKLIMPETIELGYRETAIIEQMLPDLNSLGLEIEHFGGNTFIVKSLPSLIADHEVKPLLLEIAEKMNEVGYSPGLAEALDECLILMACHGAIRAHQQLTAKEMQELLARLDDCENPFHCPHGRPTFIRWPLKQLEKSFKRTL